jgi:hypothetical protein
VGVHTIITKAYLWNGDSSTPARALIGDGTLLVDLVRLVKGQP